MANNHDKPAKKLDLWMLTALVAGNMIGSGIFLLPASLARVGSISLYSWIITGIGAMLLAFMFARLSVQIPKTGGPYAYVHAGLGDFLGFQTAYSYWVTVWVGNAAIVLAGVGYTSVFWPSLADPRHACYFAIFVIWVLTFINTLGVRSAGLVQLVTTLLKLIPILLIGLLGWRYIHPKYYQDYFNITQPHVSNFSAVTTGATLTFWSFVGLESATVPAGSVENPKRNIPLATILGTLIAALGYILSSAAIMGMLPAQVLQTDTAPFSSAAQVMFGGMGRYLVTIGAMISCFGALNGWILLQGQVAMGAADDGLFPRFFGKRSKKQVPAIGLIVTSMLVTLLLLLTTSRTLVKQFELIILLAVLSSLIPYFYTTISQFLLLKRSQKSLTSIILPTLLTLLAVIYVCWAIMGSGHATLYYGCLFLLSSVPLYAWCVSRHV